MAKNPIQVGKNFRIEVEGMSEVLKNLELTKNQRKRLQKFLKTEANKIVRTAKKIVPVDTSRLKDSHRILTYGSTGQSIVRVDIVVGGIVVRGRLVNYAAAVHQGYRQYIFGQDTGHRVPGRPWLLAAIQIHAPGYQDRLAEAIKIHGRRK